MTFRLARVSGTAVLVDETGGWHDLTRLGVEPGDTLPDPDLLHAADARLDPSTREGDIATARELGQLDTPIPTPRNCFAVGLNYGDHAAESSMELPETPLVFTKFPSCISAPDAHIVLDSAHADYEVELVIVIGRAGKDIDVAEAWDHVFGLTVGQDISDRALQFAAKPPHFDLGKSRDTYGPIGPVVVSPDIVPDRDDLAITCEVNGDRRQNSRTSSMLFDVSALVSYLSSVLTLAPGDIVFTGTPDGVGAARTPPVFLRPGDVVTSSIEGIGSITNRCR